jgi:hypothetical protein
MEFEALMQENRNSMVITDKTEWWNRRRSLDMKIKVSVFFFTNQFLCGKWVTWKRRRELFSIVLL